jgi:SOS-response transcriptional repressor LexA
MNTQYTLEEPSQAAEPMGTKLRRQRRRLGLTLDELAARAKISKPYLSLIETGRVPNPPSDEKLQRLEQTLGFPSGELVSEAHLQRTPRDVRDMLGKLLRGQSKATNGDGDNLDGLLRELVEHSAGQAERAMTNVVPLMNKMAAKGPQGSTEEAQEYISCPELEDKDAFAARVSGDSMAPQYGPGDIVIFSPATPATNGDDCFVRFRDGRTTFKRVFFESDKKNGPVFRLQPRNERYRPSTVSKDKISGLYKAFYKYQRIAAAD